ncbi:hypothetical protein HII31_02491 [Pseudocercospora fuligena]|uniref:Uncharacterized protein n=1 Tax=Pseudocercospora fuligena TaxID=685502 RepID=A0A8H6VLG2_9PEZI|nr:hypothetical protein HII31_02491 [Pseudocercospora fuligena]
MAAQGNANFNFLVCFDAGLDLVNNWKPSTLAVSHNATIDQLLSQIKSLIIRGFNVDDGYDGFEVEKEGLTALMDFLTRAHNKKNTANPAPANAMWTIRFRAKLEIRKQNGQTRSYQLEDGVWQRLPAILDFAKDPTNTGLFSNVTVRVSLELERCTPRRAATIRDDMTLNRVIYPIRQRVEYFMCGFVQNDRTQLNRYGVLRAPRNQVGSPVERKNLIIARYEECNEMALKNDFRLMGTWKFGTGNTWFRIGDPDNGGQWSPLHILEHQNTFITQTYQVNGRNPPFNGLHGTFATDKAAQYAGEVPKLPSLTFHEFPNQHQLHDPQHRLPGGIVCTIVIRVVYLVTGNAFTLNELKSPQDIRYTVTNNMTFESLAFRLWSQNGGGGQNHIPAGLTPKNTSSTWWIMLDDGSNVMRRMHRVEDEDTPVVRYVDSAATRTRNVLLYAECHIRDAGAPHRYRENGT